MDLADARSLKEDFDPGPLFDAAGQLKLKFLAEKYAGQFVATSIHSTVTIATSLSFLASLLGLLLQFNGLRLKEPRRCPP